MKLYRFSPIRTSAELLQAITHIHAAAHELCMKAVGKALPVAENIGIFAHYSDEYDFLMQLRSEMTDASVNFMQKYYLLHEEIRFTDPDATYKYVYIRKPDPYRAQVGDADFVLPKQDYEELKLQLQNDPDSNQYARIFPSQTLDLIELHDPDIDVFSYLVPMTMTESIAQQ